MGVNFFRFPFRFLGWEGKNNHQEQPRTLEKILEDVKNAMEALRSTNPTYKYNYPDTYIQSPQFKKALLDKIQRYYDELKGYEETDELARETREKLFKVLEENGRYPEEDKEEDKEE